MKLTARLIGSLLFALVVLVIAPQGAEAFTLRKSIEKGPFTYEGVKVNPAPLAKLYKANKYKGIWTSKSGLFGMKRGFTTDGKALIKLVSEASNEGLNPASYLHPSVNAGAKIGLKEIDQLEMYMTAGFLKLARDIHVGVTPKSALPEDVLKSEKKFNPAAVLESLRKNGAKRTLAALRPQHPQYEALRKAMAKTSDPSKRQLIAANLERWRWLPQDIGKNHILVNQPAYTMYLYSNGRVADQRKVIIGKTEHQTPQFSHQMSYIEFNPEWNVPPSIAVKEFVPKLLKNSNYLKNAGYRIYSGWGENAKKLDGRNISWSKIDRENYKRFPYRIVQGSGPRNALGKVKFMFPNDMDIYLHDTPAKKLFGSKARAFSHGCVRVENPMEFAKKIFEISGGITASGIDKVVASGERTPVRLKNKLPVHLAYFTAWAEKGGKIEFYNDVYNRDRAIVQHLR